MKRFRNMERIGFNKTKISMKPRSLYAIALMVCWPALQGTAQSEMIKYGDFDQWIVRNIKESRIIGGDTKQLYEIGPNAVWNENKAYTNQGGSPWGTSNVMARVCGITKTNTSVYREKRGNGYCARLETHVEKVKVMGIVNIAGCRLRFSRACAGTHHEHVQPDEQAGFGSSVQQTPVGSLL